MNSLFSLLDLDAKAGAPQLVDKTFFMVFFAGDVLRDKISKICTYFGATLYRYPDSGVEHAEMSIQVKKQKKTFAPSLPQCRTPHFLPYVQHVFQNNKKKHFLCLFLNVAPLTFATCPICISKKPKKHLFLRSPRWSRGSSSPRRCSVARIVS